MSALQDPDTLSRFLVERTFKHDRATREKKLAEIDSERKRNGPIVGAYLLSIFTLAVPIAIVIWFFMG
ncbi:MULTISPECIES: hypothetical protein [Rhizobium/Agrobacterium group]|nr:MULTISPECIES: hypothetical protein [Rhizobium/Agrobacterium group]